MVGARFERHRGDVERVVFELIVEDNSSGSRVRIDAVYTAAHEDTPFDVSATYREASLESLEYSTDPITLQPRWIIYASAGKHASYATHARCVGGSTFVCARESCATRDESLELLFPIVNVGEPTQTSYQWWNDVDPLPWWASFDAIWGGDDFCGGDQIRNDKTGCTQSIRNKLVSDPLSQ